MYSFQVFSVGEVLTASKMNAVEVNIRDHVHGTDSVSAASATTTFTLSGTISPAQITADQNNYNPTSLSTATTLRLTSDAAWTITGLAGGAAGRVVIIQNVGSFSITLADESASSDAANRFALVADTTIRADESVVLWYDTTSSMWRVLATASGGATVIASGSFPAAATLEVTDIPATYAEIIVAYVGASCTQTRTLRIQVSTDNGSNYDSTVGNYQGSTVASLFDNLGGGAASETTSGTAALKNYQGAGGYMHWTSRNYVSTPATVTLDGLYIGSANAINAIKFLWSGAGDFDAGTYAVIGVN